MQEDRQVSPVVPLVLDRYMKVEAVHAILNAAEPLAKGPDAQAVKAVLKKISGIEDQRLLDRIASLRREIGATASERNRYPFR